MNLILKYYVVKAVTLKQVVQNFKTGVVSIEDIPVPRSRRGCLLARNRASLISSGTEGIRLTSLK